MVKGLLIKDFKLMKGQKNFFIVIVVISLIMTITSPGTSYAIGFLGFIGSLFALSSISYDEFDNGNAFLFSLPITRKDYVLEKYAFGLVTGMASLLLGTIISLIAVIVTNTGDFNEILITACTFIPIILFILSIMIPFQLKFGGEKGRIAILCVMGFIFIIGVVLVKIIEFMGINLYILVKNFPQFSTQVYILLFLLFSIIALTISYYVSLLIMKKKEF